MVVDSLELQREQERREVKVSVMTEMEFVKSYWSRLDMFSLVSVTVIITSIEILEWIKREFQSQLKDNTFIFKCTIDNIFGFISYYDVVPSRRFRNIPLLQIS